MVKNTKFVFAAALALTLVACGGNVPAHNHDGMFFETATDLLNNNGIAFEAKKIGGVDAVDVSSTYAQYGVDKDGNYCLRFATAVQGDITDITYTRKGIEGVADGLDKVINVTTVYKAIYSDGLPTYYDGSNPSTTTGEGDYYWACYTICYQSEEAKQSYDLNVEMELAINGETVQTRTTSLNKVMNASKDKSYFYQAETADLVNGSSNFRTDEIIVDRHILGNVNGNVGATISFNVESESVAEATLYASTCERAMEINLDEALKIEVNGVQVTSGEIIKPLVEGYHYWFTYSEKKLADINLVEGTNNVKITILAAETFSIDYFKVVTKADVTNGQDVACNQLCNECGKCVNLECGYHDEKCVTEGENSYRFDGKDAILAGGNGVEAGDFVGNNGSGKSITFKFNSDKAGKASLSGTVSTNGVSGKDALYSSFFAVQTNGKDMDLSNVYVHRMQKASWMDFLEVGLGCIELVEGENTIVFSGVGAASFDYIVVNTDSVINEGQPTHHHLCPTCNKSLDARCRASECEEKCEAHGDRYEFTASEATLINNAKRESNNTIIGGLSGSVGNGVSYTFNVESETTIGFSIELNDRQRKAFFSNSVDITIDGTKYVSGAQRRTTWEASDNWSLFYELYLGCVNLSEGEHTISFVVNTNHGYANSNMRNFYITSPVAITK